MDTKLPAEVKLFFWSISIFYFFFLSEKGEGERDLLRTGYKDHLIFISDLVANGGDNTLHGDGPLVDIEIVRLWLTIKKGVPKLLGLVHILHS